MGCAHGRVLAHCALDEDARDADDEHADKVGDLRRVEFGIWLSNTKDKFELTRKAAPPFL